MGCGCLTRCFHHQFVGWEQSPPARCLFLSGCNASLPAVRDISKSNPLQPPQKPLSRSATIQSSIFSPNTPESHRAGTPPEPCCQFLNAHPPPPPASSPRKSPWLPHMLLSRNAGIKSVQRGPAEPGCATWAGWKQPDLPGDQGGWGTVWPPSPCPQTHTLPAS